MLDEKGKNEFHIVVGHRKLEEIRHRDGHTYIEMPLFDKTAYGVEYAEEIKGHGAIERIVQKWPVCPYKVAVRNLSEKGCFALLVVDGQKVAEKYVPAGGSIIFEGIPTEEGIQELLFSLPRFATLREKDIGGRALPESTTSELGTIKIVWRDCVKTGTEFRDNYRSYRTSSFKQANKEDAKATKGGAGTRNSESSHASTTRAGKVVGLNESRSCTVSNYQYVGEPWDARVLYRTRHVLEEIGALTPLDSEADAAERMAKRIRKRKKRKAEEEAQNGGAFVPPVPIDAQVPVDEED